MAALREQSEIADSRGLGHFRFADERQPEAAARIPSEVLGFLARYTQPRALRNGTIKKYVTEIGRVGRKK